MNWLPFAHIFLIIAFLVNTFGPIPVAQAQDFRLPTPGVMVHLSPEFTPAQLKGIIIHPENALKFDFIIYKGDQVLSEQEKKFEYTKLIKYFLASLAIPDDDQWVNLSPYEKNRIIKEDFGRTEMGRDLLAQDYMLKQVTASLIYPQDKLGQEFWNKVYAKAYQQFGTTNIPVNTFNKVWIVPDDAEVFEKGNLAYVVKDHLKVMLEEDYLSLNKHNGIQTSPGDQNKTHTIGSQIVREVVLPALEREVNEGKNFAPLRQVFSGVVLAAWYKLELKESFLGKIYMNKSRLKGVDQDPKNNQIIYQQYLKAFKKGVFNFIKEDVDKYSNENIPRKYFSGGAELMKSLTRGILEINGGKPVLNVDRFPSSAQLTDAAMDSNNDDVVEVAAKILDYRNKLSDSDSAMTESSQESSGNKKEYYTWDMLQVEGYTIKERIILNSKDAPKILEVDVLQHGEFVSNDIRFYIYPKQKVVFIGRFYPELYGGYGQGRALLRKILDSSEYAGFYVISSASDIFRGSLAKMNDYNFRIDTDYHPDGLLRKREFKKLIFSSFWMGGKLTLAQWYHLYLWVLHSNVYGIVPAKTTDGAQLSSSSIMLDNPTINSKVLLDRRRNGSKDKNKTMIVNNSKGGIDFNSTYLNLKAKHIGNSVPLIFAHQDMAQLNNLEGLDPVILQIQPAKDSIIFSKLIQPQV